MTTPSQPPRTLPEDRGASLRERRLSAGLSIPQLAGLADCSPGSIERIEQGYRPKRSSVLVAVYTALADAEARR